MHRAFREPELIGIYPCAMMCVATVHRPTSGAAMFVGREGVELERRSIALAAPASTGQHRLRARQIDAAGNEWRQLAFER
jgi:hypothetical protein